MYCTFLERGPWVVHFILGDGLIFKLSLSCKRETRSSYSVSQWKIKKQTGANILRAFEILELLRPICSAVLEMQLPALLCMHLYSHANVWCRYLNILMGLAAQMLGSLLCTMLSSYHCLAFHSWKACWDLKFWRSVHFMLIVWGFPQMECIALLGNLFAPLYL